MSMPLRRQDPISTDTIRKSVESPRRSAALSRKRNYRRALSILIALVLVGSAAGGELAARARTSVSELSLELRASSGGRVGLESASAERRLGFVTVTGSVKNRSARSWSHVEVIVELLDDKGSAVAVESSLIAFDRLLVHDSAPFRVELQDVPRATRYRIRFRQLLGPTLD